MVFMFGTVMPSITLALKLRKSVCKRLCLHFNTFVCVCMCVRALQNETGRNLKVNWRNHRAHRIPFKESTERH